MTLFNKKIEYFLLTDKKRHKNPIFIPKIANKNKYKTKNIKKNTNKT